MTTQPKALELAGSQQHSVADTAAMAAELRRLHAENTTLALRCENMRKLLATYARLREGAALLRARAAIANGATNV